MLSTFGRNPTKPVFFMCVVSPIILKLPGRQELFVGLFPGFAHHAGSPITGRRSSCTGRRSPAWPCSTTTTGTGSSGTTWPATTRSQSYARMLRVTLPSPGKPSQTSGYLEGDWSSLLRIIKLFIYCSSVFSPMLASN